MMILTDSEIKVIQRLVSGESWESLKGSRSWETFKLEEGLTDRSLLKFQILGFPCDTSTQTQK